MSQFFHDLWAELSILGMYRASWLIERKRCVALRQQNVALTKKLDESYDTIFQQRAEIQRLSRGS